MKHRRSARLAPLALLTAIALPTLAFAHPGHGSEDGTTAFAAMLAGAAIGAASLLGTALRARARRSRTSPAAAAPARPSTSSH